MSEPNKVIETLKDWIDTTFQLDRLDDLARKSIFISAAYSGLIGNINYCMMHEPAIGNEHIAVGGQQYPLTLKGRKAAIAESFRHFSNKIDDFLTVANMSTIIGSIDFISDIASAAVPSTIVHKKA